MMKLGNGLKMKLTWRFCLSLLGFAVFAFCLLLYVSLSPPFAQHLYDTVILRPLKYPGGSYQKTVLDGVAGKDVFFNSLDGRYKLNGRYFQLPGAEKTVLISHGIGGNLTSRADLTGLVLDSGASALIYDYEGYGKSEGEASLRNVCNDGEAAYRYLTCEMKIKPANVIVCGESLGTGVTCYLAKNNPVAGVILQSPFSCLTKRCAEVVPFLNLYPSWLFPADGLNNSDIVRNLKAPLLIVHGERDRMIPVKHALELFSTAVQPKKLVLVPEGAHTGDPKLMQSPLYLQAVRQFLATIR